MFLCSNFPQLLSTLEVQVARSSPLFSLRLWLRIRLLDGAVHLLIQDCAVFSAIWCRLSPHTNDFDTLEVLRSIIQVYQKRPANPHICICRTKNNPTLPPRRRHSTTAAQQQEGITPRGSVRPDIRGKPPDSLWVMPNRRPCQGSEVCVSLSVSLCPCLCLSVRAWQLWLEGALLIVFKLYTSIHPERLLRLFPVAQTKRRRHCETILPQMVFGRKETNDV